MQWPLWLDLVVMGGAALAGVFLFALGVEAADWQRRQSS